MSIYTYSVLIEGNLYMKVRTYYAKHGIERQSRTPYQHWQNSVERDRHPDDDTQQLSRHPRISTHACRLLESSKHWIKVYNDLPRSAYRYSPNAIMDNTHQVDARYQYRFAYGDIVCYYPLAEKERRWKFYTKNEMGFTSEGYKGWMSRLSALLPQVPYQRRCAPSTHIRDRTHGMVREASSCETIGTVMGSGRGSHRRSTQGQAVHERKRPKTTSRGQRRHLGRQRPGRHGTGATTAYARST